MGKWSSSGIKGGGTGCFWWLAVHLSYGPTIPKCFSNDLHVGSYNVFILLQFCCTESMVHSRCIPYHSFSIPQFLMQCFGFAAIINQDIGQVCLLDTYFSVSSPPSIKFKWSFYQDLSEMNYRKMTFLITILFISFSLQHLSVIQLVGCRPFPFISRFFTPSKLLQTSSYSLLKKKNFLRIHCAFKTNLPSIYISTGGEKTPYPLQYFTK